MWVSGRLVGDARLVLYCRKGMLRKVGGECKNKRASYPVEVNFVVGVRLQPFERVQPMVAPSRPRLLRLAAAKGRFEGVVRQT